MLVSRHHFDEEPYEKLDVVDGRLVDASERALLAGVRALGTRYEVLELGRALLRIRLAREDELLRVRLLAQVGETPLIQSEIERIALLRVIVLARLEDEATRARRVLDLIER